jgi:hypothetical protein
MIHPAEGNHSRLPTISLLVATAAAGLAMASLVVAADDDVTTLVPEVVPAEQDVDQAPATPRHVEHDEIDEPATDRFPAERIRPLGDGCYETAIGSVIC